MVVQIIEEKSGMIIQLPRERLLQYIDKKYPSINQIFVRQVNDWLEHNRKKRRASRHFAGFFYLTIIEPESE